MDRADTHVWTAHNGPGAKATQTSTPPPQPKQDWRYLIIDEAHRTKSESSVLDRRRRHSRAVNAGAWVTMQVDCRESVDCQLWACCGRQFGLRRPGLLAQ